MRYEPLEEAGHLTIKYEGPDLDLYSFALLQLHLQGIIDRVAYADLERLYRFSSSVRRYRRTGFFYDHEPQSIVRSEVSRLEYGSYELELSFFIASFADPDLRAALQGFAGNVIYAISRSGLNVVRRYLRGEPRGQKNRDGSRDLFDVGPNIRGIVKQVSESIDGRGARIRIWRDPEGHEEVHIEIDGE